MINTHSAEAVASTVRVVSVTRVHAPLRGGNAVRKCKSELVFRTLAIFSGHVTKCYPVLLKSKNSLTLWHEHIFRDLGSFLKFRGFSRHPLPDATW